MSRSRNCWYCGRDTMKPVADAVHPYSECSKCGATRDELVKPKAPVAVLEDRVSIDQIGEKRRRWKPKPQRKKT